MALQSLRGTTDLLPEDVKRWTTVEQTARRLARAYGYEEVRTPLIEDAAVFLRSVGETTDIVQKEMFRFEDRGGQDIVLRPEGTASIVRAYLEHHLHKTHGFVKLFYLGPMFRAERPQAGRFRQFHQYGVEAIGSASPWVDVETIVLCVEILRACGVSDLSVWLSTMGCRDDQHATSATLRKQLEPYKDTLCKECQARFDRNVFRVLDCKNPSCQAIVREHVRPLKPRAGFPPTPFQLCDACAAHFDEVRKGLREANAPFDDTQVFARGLDYYTRTVFEVRAKGLGAQDAVAAGGRYDHLVEEFGGPPTGAVGFAAGIERVLMAAKDVQSPGAPDQHRRGVYLAVLKPDFTGLAFLMAQVLRKSGVTALIDFEGRSLKAQFREADRMQARWIGILGEKEASEKSVTVKDLEQGTQEMVSIEDFLKQMTQEAGAPA